MVDSGARDDGKPFSNQFTTSKLPLFPRANRVTAPSDHTRQTMVSSAFRMVGYTRNCHYNSIEIVAAVVSSAQVPTSCIVALLKKEKTHYRCQDFRVPSS